MDQVMKGSYWIISSRFPWMFSDFEGCGQNWNVQCPCNPSCFFLVGSWHQLFGSFPVRTMGICSSKMGSLSPLPNSWKEWWLCEGQTKPRSRTVQKECLRRIRGRFEDCRNQAILCHSIVDLMPSLLGHGGFAQVHRRGVLQFACCSVGHLQLSSKLLDITLAGCTPPISASFQNEDRPRAVTPWFKPAMGWVEYEEVSDMER